MKTHLKKLLAGSLAAALCLLSGCTSAPDMRDDPLSGYNANALPFGTRIPGAVETTSTPTDAPLPGSTGIVSLPQDWQNESAPENDHSTNVPTRIPTQIPTPTPTQTPSYTRPAYTYTKLEQGDKGDEVVRLQARLIELGYLSGSADGTYGANTKAAVKRFQKELGISQTGVASVSLQEKLFMSNAPAYQVEVIVTRVPDVTVFYEPLVRDDRGEAVRKLQARLIELGYLTGTADGVFGANTENAVKRFQGVIGMTQTGVASAAVQSNLFSVNAPYAPAPTPTPTPKPTPTPEPTLSYQQLEPGDIGTEVARMQNRLKELGYFSGSATGNYYRETTEAVKLFQKAINMSETGIASSAMLIALYSAEAPHYSANTQTAPTDVPGGYTLLRTGSTGTEVVNLQKRLVALGYLSGSADGYFGPGTESAVKRFQQQVGFEQNGIASVGLQNLLFSAAAPTYAPIHTPVPTVPATQAPTSRYQQLEPGDSGAAVKQMQTRLKELGFFAGQLGGNYLTKTTDSVKLFQAAIGHAQTGIATPEMQEILFSEDAPDYDSVESDYITLEKLDSGIQVLYLQQRLKELGYLTGAVDGDFGGQTEKAVTAFQQQVGLPATGKATPETQIILFSAAAPGAPVPTNVPTQVPTSIPTQVPTQAPTQTPEPTGYTTLKNDSSGDAVKNLQSRLKALGYFEGNVAGNYLLKTETAVRLFQAQCGFQVDGIAAPALQEHLFSSSAPYYNGSAYIDLYNGMTGPAVRNLQTALISAGYLSGSADGDFGNGTEKAVKALQNTLGMADDGIASVALQRVLFSGGVPAAPTTTPVPTQVPTQVPGQPTQYSTLSVGIRSSEEVSALQTRLTELGYFMNKITGGYWEQTADAVKLFQVQNGYPADGVATPELQQFLYSDAAPRFNGSAYIDLSEGMLNPAVRNLQQALNNLGYLTNPADGSYGSNTVKAVKKLQQNFGMEATGIATVQLQQMLFSGSAPVPTQVPTQAPTQVPEQPTQYSTLSVGIRSSEEVSALQTRLTELGYFTNKITGGYWEQTADAVKLFQVQNGYPADGVATPELQQFLYSDAAPRFNGSAYIELSEGMLNPAVFNLQQALNSLGYLTNTADGSYGSNTVKAVKKLQQDLGMEATGIATVQLQQKLFSGSVAPSVTSAPAQPPVSNNYSTLKNGSSGDQVIALQTRLLELGYYNGLLKGNYMGITELAVKLFQAQNGYTPDGIASAQIQEALFASNAPEYNATAFIDLKKGDEGVAVVTLQKRLIQLGYLNGSADGEYGSGTETAVKAFQQAVNHSSVNGSASAALQQLLFSADAPAYGEAPGSSANTPVPDNTAAPENTGSITSLNDYRTVKNGNSGEDVKAMQRRLKELGYFNGDIGGNYLTKTQTAVELFQTALGVPVDGIATPLLQVRLFSSSAPAYVEPESKPDQYNVLFIGESGAQVKALQKRLIQLGWLNGTADGDFGPATQQALTAFQYRVGLPQDGIASIELQELLYAPTAPQYVEYAALQPGAKGNAVFNMQLRLIELGYLDAEAANLDGIYGNGLKNALSELQKASGVDPQAADGIATVELQTFLFSTNAVLYSRAR